MGTTTFVAVWPGGRAGARGRGAGPAATGPGRRAKEVEWTWGSAARRGRKVPGGRGGIHFCGGGRGWGDLWEIPLGMLSCL